MPKPDNASRPTIGVVASPSDTLEQALRPLRDRAALVFGSDRAGLGAAWGEARALCVWGRPPEDFGTRLRAAPRVRWVHSGGVGVERLVVPELVDRPIVLTNSRGLYDTSMAEYALTLMLAHVKRVPELVIAQRERRWLPGLSRDLAGSTLVILGLGGVGAALARRARAFGTRVLGVRRSGRPAPRLAERVYPTAELDRALPEAAYLAICCPDTPETRGLIGARELGLLPAGAFLVNVARGTIVDEPALIDALRSGHLGGAGLDAYVREPLPPSSPLWELPGVIVSPHCSATTDGWDTRTIQLFLDNVDRFLAGRRPRGVVDKRRGY